jgi:hypothetical protein
MPEIELETNPLPEIEGTAEEKLSASLAALKMTNQAHIKSFYSSGTQCASNLKTILTFLHASVESGGGHGGTQGGPAALYVCGVPGTICPWLSRVCIRQQLDDTDPLEQKSLAFGDRYLSAAGSISTAVLPYSCACVDAP